jgi:hypothetical protein
LRQFHQEKLTIVKASLPAGIKKYGRRENEPWHPQEGNNITKAVCTDTAPDG